MAEKLAKLKLNQNSQKMERSQINKQSEKLTESSRWQNNTIQNHTILKVRPPLNKSEPIELFFKSIKLDNYVLKLKKKYSLIFKKNNYSKLIYHQDTKLEESKIIRKLKQSSQVSQVNIQNESKYDEVEGITIQSQQNLKLTQFYQIYQKKSSLNIERKLNAKKFTFQQKGKLDDYSNIQQSLHQSSILNQLEEISNYIHQNHIGEQSDKSIQSILQQLKKDDNNIHLISVAKQKPYASKKYCKFKNQESSLLELLQINYQRFCYKYQ